ncbi:unnamed protein product [Thlaspi arvense]|uniref:F-box domain-containing protein n=1 Tax=Thlaspi arvense TaxID=13288 RepID=A0AAU9SFL0_THLAR|nr:unnamed protein product [Thlaspi arvense]
MNEDRISKLPEVLILQILSLLPTKSAVVTSVLSKEWKFLWKMIPRLEFDSCDHKGELGTFSNNVCKSLLSHKAPVLESLHISFTFDSCDASDIGMWIGIAYAQHVRKLVLDVESKGPGRVFPLPRSLYNCEILETLRLTSCLLFLKDSSQVCLKSLKTLHLLSMIYDGSFLHLLSGCPNLENLLFNTSPGYARVAFFPISVPSLLRLSFRIQSCNGCSYVINTPSLKYMEIEAKHILEFRLIESVTNLVEANLYIEYISPMASENLLRSLTSAKRLSLELAPLEIKFPTGIIFNQLVHLELYTTREAWWNLLFFMLSDSPNLRVLKLINLENYWRDGFKSSGKWNHPENFPKCLLFHLETFTWEGYSKWLVQEEKKVARYILINAYRLKRATFSLTDMSSEESGELIQNLKKVRKASKSCKLMFK